MLKAYVVPPVDEVQLLACAAERAAAFGGRVPGRAELQALTAEMGVEMATAVFYQAIRVAAGHAAFIAKVERQAAAPMPGHAPATLVIVPALYYRELPQYGGDGAAIVAVAQACGFTTETVPVASKGSLRRNAAILAETLAATAGPVVLLSLSVGGGSVRLLLEERRGDPLLDRIAGWVNVCGLVRGVPLAERLLAHPLRRLHARALCGVIGLDFDLVRELDPAYPAWQRPFLIPAHLRVINLIGVPLHAHVQQRSLFKRYGWMQALGPNDGMALLPDLLAEPGDIYPLWGADHYFRTPQVSPLFYRLFRTLRVDWLTV